MRLILSAICVLAFTCLTNGQQQLSLEEAVTIALNRNTTLQKSQNNLQNYEADVKSSYGSLLPSFGVGGGFNWSRRETEGGVQVIQGFPIELPSSKEENRNYSAGANAQWVIFDGLANIAGISQSKNNLESAELQLERLKQDVVFQTVSLYYDVVNYQQLLKVREEDVVWNQKNLETVTERNKLGAVTLADVYAQQVRAGNAELEVVRTRNLLETSRSNLLYYLGLDVLADYQVKDSLTTEELSVLDDRLSEDYEKVSVLVDQALSSRSDFKGAKLNLESAEDGVTIAWAGHLPRLSNNNSFSTYADTPGDLFTNKTYSVGLSLDIPIFSGFRVEQQVQAAEVNVKLREIEITELERNIKANIKQTFLDLEAAEKALEVSRRNVKSAELNRQIESEKYNLGSGTLLNVLISNSEFTNAQSNFINSQFAYVVLSEQLKYYLGILDYKKYE